MHTDDQRLAERARRGDQAAFDQLLDIYRERLIRYCWRFMRSREAAEDAAQDTITRALERRHTYRGDAPVYNWICSIARNVCLNLLRPVGPTIAPGGIEHPAVANAEDPGPDPSEGVWTAIWLALVGRLSLEDLLIVRLHLQLEYSLGDIARMRQTKYTNYGTLKSRYRRIIKPVISAVLIELGLHPQTRLEVSISAEDRMP